MSHSSAFAILGLSLLAHDATAQSGCGSWSADFNLSGVPHIVHAIVECDLGSGPRVFAGGYNPAPGASALSAWDGTEWETVPGIANGIVDLEAFDDGTGLALYACGGFGAAGNSGARFIARWDGHDWSRVGTSDFNTGISALAVYDDGSGAKLYAGGAFTQYGSQSMPVFTRWDGNEWVALTAAIGSVNDLLVHDDGSGPALFLGGDFSFIGGLFTAGAARYSAQGWSGFGTSLGFNVGALGAFDFGSGEQLVVGSSLGPPRASRWDGTQWIALPALLAGNSSSVTAITSFDDGSGAKLHLGLNNFSSPLQRLDGAVWTAVLTSGNVSSAVVRNESAGPRLWVGLDSGFLDGLHSSGITSWDGSNWHSLGRGFGLVMSANTLAVHDDGSGSKLYAASSAVERFDGSRWEQVGPVPNGVVRELLTFDDGGGEKLYALGGFTTFGVGGLPGIARWNGTSWEALSGTWPLPGGFDLDRAVVHDDGGGPALYLSRNVYGFTNLVRWRGGVFDLIASSTAGRNAALASFDDGTGAQLYSVGPHEPTPGAQAQSLARWNGSGWNPLATTPFGNVVDALMVHDDGHGPGLYVAGSFTTLGGVALSNIARWTPSGLSTVGPGVPAAIESMASLDFGLGAGRELVVGRKAFSAVAPLVASWDGSTWTTRAGASSPGMCLALAEYDDGTGRDVFVAGGLTVVEGERCSRIARFDGCGETGRTYCFGDGSTLACPCGNASAPSERAGCRHSLGTGGALRARGAAVLSNDTLALDGSAMPNSSALYFQAAARTAGSTFGDGITCTGGPFVRLATQNNSAGLSTYPEAGEPSISTKGFVTATGTRRYQVRYRNAAAFCTAETFNYTNAVEIVWGS